MHLYYYVVYILLVLGHSTWYSMKRNDVCRSNRYYLYYV